MSGYVLCCKKKRVKSDTQLNPRRRTEGICEGLRRWNTPRWSFCETRGSERNVKLMNYLLATPSPDKQKIESVRKKRTSKLTTELLHEKLSVLFCVHLQVQLKPFPLNPAEQLHWYEPSVFEQSALRSHSFSFAWHSSTSKKKIKSNDLQ